MKSCRYFYAGFLILAMFLNCYQKNQPNLADTDLTVFTQKADLKTREAYQNWRHAPQSQPLIPLLIKCSQFGEAEREQLLQLQITIKSVNEHIISVECPAALLPELARLNFVTTIEAGRQAKYK